MPLPASKTQAVAMVNKDNSLTEYVPFGSKDVVKLSVAIVQNLIAVKTKSGHNCSQADALKFIAMCKARALNPLEGDAFLIGYDTQDGPKFSLITAHQAFLKRAELHPEYDGMKSGIIVRNTDGTIADLEGDFYLPDEHEVLGGWATVYFKNRKYPMHKRLRLARFAKSFGVWKDDGAGMICKCAEADGLRSSFPTMLGGLYLREEIDLFPETTATVAAAAPPPTFLGPIDTEDAPPGAEMPEKPRQEPEPEPVREPEQAPSDSITPEEAEYGFINLDAATAATLTGPALLERIQANLKAAEITGDQLTAWARKSSLCKPDMAWSDMSEAKLRSVLTKWSAIGPTVKGITL